MTALHFCSSGQQPTESQEVINYSKRFSFRVAKIRHLRIGCEVIALRQVNQDSS